MEKETRVSVIVPAWNAEDKLDACLEAITGQTLTDIEIIVVDDGSTDGTWPLLNRWSQRDPRIIALHQENSGVSVARNTGLSHAGGTWVRFVDVDDSMSPDSLAILVAKGESSCADLVIGGFTVVQGPVRRSRNLLHRDDAMDCELFLRILSQKPNAFFYGVVWNKLYRRALLAENHCEFLPQCHWGEDFAFNCDVLNGASRVALLDQSVYDYSITPSGLTWHMALNCVCHPWRSIQLKRMLFQRYRGLLQRRCPDHYRRRSLRYLWGTTIGE